MTIAWIGLGANLGDARATLDAAMSALAALPGSGLMARSAFYASAPVGTTGPDFINAVARLDTTLAPEALLAALLAIEQTHGRERPWRHAPRTLDLDLLLHGEAVMDTPTLTLPHPRMHQRAFVLLPLAELAPGLAIPGHGLVSALLAALPPQRIDRLA